MGIFPFVLAIVIWFALHGSLVPIWSIIDAARFDPKWPQFV